MHDMLWYTRIMGESACYRSRTVGKVPRLPYGSAHFGLARVLHSRAVSSRRADSIPILLTFSRALELNKRHAIPSAYDSTSSIRLGFCRLVACQLALVVRDKTLRNGPPYKSCRESNLVMFARSCCSHQCVRYLLSQTV